MNIFKCVTVGTVLAGSLSSLSTMAMPVETTSQYYVRPGLRVGGGAFQDGLQENGPTSAVQSQSVSGFSRSTVDLTQGTVKMYAEEPSITQVGLQTFGGFGERLTIRNGAGTNWGMNFGIEGEAYGDLGPRAPGGPLPVVIYNVGVVVHEAGVADWSNFLGLANDPCWGQDPLECNPAPAALVNNSSQGIYDVPVEDYAEGIDQFFEYLSTAVSANVALETNNETFDLFVYTNVFMAFDTLGPGSGLRNYVLDFENTATYDQTFAQGVDVFSSSGQFLGLTTPPPIDPPGNVPTPGALPLFGLGLLALALGRRRA